MQQYLKHNQNIPESFRTKVEDFKKKLEEDRVAQEKYEKAKSLREANELNQVYEAPKIREKQKNRIYDPDDE